MARESPDFILTFEHYEGFLVELRKRAKPNTQIYNQQRYTGIGRYNDADLFLEELPGLLRIRSPWTQREGVYGDIRVIRASEYVYLMLPGPSQDGIRSRALKWWILFVFLLSIVSGIYFGDFLGGITPTLFLITPIFLTALLVDSQYNKHRSAIRALVESASGTAMRDSTSEISA